jgi:hypothetical protein
MGAGSGTPRGGDGPADRFPYLASLRADGEAASPGDRSSAPLDA